MIGKVRFPEWAWHRPDLRKALQVRDVPALFRFAQKYTGASQSALAVATGLGQGRVNEIINGRRAVVRLDVLERIADGLCMPDDARQLLGLAARQAFAPEIARVYGDQAEAAADIRVAARSAAKLEVLAVRGLGLLGLNDSLLRDAVLSRDAVTVRVLLLHPDSRAAEQRAAEVGETVDTMAAGIRLATARLQELSDLSGVDLQAYWYRQLPVWRMIGVDGTMWVSVFDPALEGHEGALYKLVPTPNAVLQRGYRRMFEALRLSAERVI
jgi:transcriptional regulator with XRE-family HTH domain